MNSASGDPEQAVAAPPERNGYRDSIWWNLGFSAFWFATSFKWFILLNGLLAAHVKSIVPGGEQNVAWGRVVAIGAAEAMIGPILIGMLSDRCCSRWGRRRPFIAIGAALTSLALLFMSQANSLWIMVVAYLLLQISDDVGTAPYQAMIPDLVPQEQRGRASGVMAVLQQLAQVVAVAAVLLLGSVAPGAFPIFAAIAAVNIVGALIVLLTVRETPHVRSLSPTPAVRRPATLARLAEPWTAPWRTRDFRWVWFTKFLNALGFYLILLYLHDYLDEVVRDFSLFGLRLGKALEAQMVIGVVLAVAACASAVYAGKLADRIGRKRVILMAGYLMFACLVPFAFVKAYAGIVLLAIGFGIGYGAYLSADWALVSDVLPDKAETARDMGMWSMSVPMSQMVAGWAGLLLTLGNRAGHGFGFTGTFLVAAVAFLLSTVLIRQVRGSI